MPIFCWWRYELETSYSATLLPSLPIQNLWKLFLVCFIWKCLISIEKQILVYQISKPLPIKTSTLNCTYFINLYKRNKVFQINFTLLFTFFGPFNVRYVTWNILSALFLLSYPGEAINLQNFVLKWFSKVCITK